MTKEEKTAQLIKNLRKLLPNSPGLLWDEAVSLERRGHEHLINGENDKAIALYQEGLQKKGELLKQMDGLPDRDDKAISLVRSAYHLAAVCQKSGRFDESSDTLRQLIETAQTIRTCQYQNESRQFLQDAYSMMAALVPWLSMV